MKHKRTQSPPLSIPRSGSLLHRLQHAPEPEEGAQSYLDQLMIFLDDPPAGVRDRWKKGAKMCAAWGVPCNGASVWRLYRSYAIEWRLRLAHETDSTTAESPDAFDEKLAKLSSVRTFEALTNPHLPPDCLLGLARIELRKKLLAFARIQHRDKMRNRVELALDIFARELPKEPEALDAFNQLNKALRHHLEHLPDEYGE